MKSYFVTELVVEQISDKFWKLKEPLIYYSKLLNMEITVPLGYQTDFASVPRVPIAYTLFGNRAHRESVIHDWIYSTHLVTRKMADKVFMEAMKARKKPFFVRWAMYLGVRLGGWKAFNNYRRKEKS